LWSCSLTFETVTALAYAQHTRLPVTSP